MAVGVREHRPERSLPPSPLTTYGGAVVDEGSRVSHKDLIRRFVAEIPNQGNVAAIGDYLDPGYVLHFPQFPVVAGAEPFQRVPEAMKTAFPDLRETIEDLLEDGDRVVERLTLHGTHLGDFMGIAPTGREVTWSAIAIYRIANNKIIENWVEANLLGLLIQLGVLVAPAPLLD